MFDNFSSLANQTVLNPVMNTYFSQGLLVYPGNFSLFNFPFVPYTTSANTAVQ